MYKSLKDVNDLLKEINDRIPSFETDERKEIKKNNKAIKDYLKDLEDIKTILTEELKTKYNNNLPIKLEDSGDDNVIGKLIDKVLLSSDNSFMTKLKLNNNLYEIRNSNKYDVINKNIMDLLIKFKTVGVILTPEDFKYSLSLYKYMGTLFNNINKDDFKIKEVFDALYWDSPNIVMHVYLAFIELIELNKEKFESYIVTNTVGEHINLLDLLHREIIKDNNKKYTNQYEIFNLFANNTLIIDDYATESPYKKDTINKFTNYEKYCTFNREERIHFDENINVLYNDLCEYNFINKYCYLIDNIKDIYTKKKEHLNDYKIFMKKKNLLTRQKDKLNTKLFNLCNKFDENNKKVVNLFNKVNIKINEIIELYKDYDEIMFINDVVTKLDDDSTYEDAFKIYVNNYGYLMKFIIDNEGSYEEVIRFIYNPYIDISDSIPILSEVDISQKLVDKYKLFGIEIDLKDLATLQKDLEYIIRLENFKTYNVDLSKIKLLLDTNKILSN